MKTTFNHLIAMSLMQLLGISAAWAETVSLPTAAGEYVNWNDAVLINCNVENNGANIGSTHQGSKATFTLYNPKTQRIYLSFGSGSKYEASVTVTITNANATELYRKTFAVPNTGNWDYTKTTHEARIDNLEKGELTLTFDFATEGSYAGNYGRLSLVNDDVIYADYPQIPGDNFSLPEGQYTQYSKTETGTTVPKYESGNQNIGYIKNGGIAEYTFFATQAGYYDLQMGISTYSGGTIRTTITDLVTNEIDLQQDLTIPNSSNYESQTLSLTDPITVKGPKKLRMEFVADHDSWVMNYKDVTLVKRANYGEVATEYHVSYGQNLPEAGTVSQSPSGSTLEEGTKVKFTAKPNFGYHFIKWTDAEGNDLSTDNPLALTVSGDISVLAIFEAVATYQLTLNVEGGSSSLVSITPAATVVNGKNMYEEGTVVTLVASQNEVLTFASWEDGTTNATRQITMNADTEVTALYAQGDFLAAWDLHDTNKGNPYIADYYSSEDNENASFYLRNFETGQVTSRGYWVRSEGCAVIWGDDVNYAYEFRVNSLNFTDLRVKCDLWYSYNYWEKVQGQYSTDTENWINVGEPITMTSARTTYEWTLPAEAEHQSSLYFRLLPDVNSPVLNEGASTYRPLWIDDIYFFGQGAIYDDGTAPKLVSTTPAEGATGASATGKVVLTFDEKVQITDAAVATLNDQPVSGTATGTIVTFPYTGLAYGTDYTFSLVAGSVADPAGNANTEAITLHFTTMTRPSVTKKGFDFVVGVDGTIDEAIAAANAQNSNRFRIFIPNGTYKLEGNDSNGVSSHSITRVRQTVSLIGQDRDSTTIYNNPTTGYGITQCSTINFQSGNGNYVQDLCIQNRRGVNGGQAAALHESTERNIYYHATLSGNQDTYVSGHREYFEDCIIAGSVDFICGGGDIWFERCDLQVTRKGSVLTAPSTQPTQKWGYVFNGCTVSKWQGVVYDVTESSTTTNEAADGSYSLGRPWQNSPASTFLYTKMELVSNAAGWQSMSSDKVCRFHEYGTMDKHGNAIDLSTRSIASLNPDPASDEPVLTKEQADKYTMQATLNCESDGWVPTLYTEQCVAPEVTLKGDLLSWADDPYASCYVLFKDNVYVANLTDCSYELTELGSYTVRAANEMGGLGVASAEIYFDPDGVSIFEVGADSAATTCCYDLTGRRVAAPRAGTFFVREGRIMMMK